MAAKRKTRTNTIDEYLAAVSDDQRAGLEKLRKTIQAAAPKAEECISYGSDSGARCRFSTGRYSRTGSRSLTFAARNLRSARSAAFRSFPLLSARDPRNARRLSAVSRPLVRPGRVDAVRSGGADGDECARADGNRRVPLPQLRCADVSDRCTVSRMWEAGSVPPRTRWRAHGGGASFGRFDRDAGWLSGRRSPDGATP